MENDTLISILAKWNLWSTDVAGADVGIERYAYVNKILNLLEEKFAVAEAGVRRSGKSFIAKQVAKRFALKHDAKNVLIINLEDERFIERTYSLLLQIYDAYKGIVKPDKKPLIVIDEAQEVDGWERFVRGLLERNEAKFIVTGSSSKLLSSEYSTLLSGRAITIQVMPLDFSEFLFFNGIKHEQLELAINAEKVSGYFEEYLHYGGFPAVVPSKEKEEILLSYFDTIMVKDVISRYRIREEHKVRALSRFYLTSIASEITYNSVAKFLKMPVKTAQRFSEYIASSNVIFFVERFSFSQKERENSPRKVYSIDNGLASVLGTNFIEIKGRLLENMVAQQLLRLCHTNKNTSFYYWRDNVSGKKVDFILKQNNELLPIQVAYSIENEATKKREITALVKCARSINAKKGVIITYDYSGSETIDGVEIEYLKAASFLLKT